MLLAGSIKCPECGVPVWMNDLNPNRQLNNIIKSMNIIKRIVTSGDIPCPTGAENLQQSCKDASSDLFSDFGLSSAPEMSSKDSLDDLEEKQQSNVRLSMPHLPRRPLRYHTRGSRVQTSRPTGESVLTISDSKSSLFAKEESQEASVPRDDLSSVSLLASDQAGSKFPDRSVSKSSLFAKEQPQKADVLSEDNSSVSVSASYQTGSKSRGKSVFKNKPTTNTDITSNTVDNKAKEHTETSDNHQSTMLPPAHTKVSSKGLSHSSISDSTPTVDVDLTSATLDIADVEQKLRQAAQLATSLRTVMKHEAASPAPEEMRSSGGLEESYVSNISFFEPSSPKRSCQGSEKSLGEF